MKPGDVVRLQLAREEIECTLLESYDSGVVLVKLDSGYNIGIPKEHILGSEVIQEYTEKQAKTSISQQSDKPVIGLVVTGGTIASKLDSKTGAVSPLTNVNEFARFYPKLFERARVKIVTPFMKLSENMDSHDWIVLAQQVKTLLDDSEVKGIVITHGTDTLHYTAAALSFFLHDLNKPVVLTYSQRSIDRASSDAELNLECAAEFALSDCAEVVLVGHADLNDDFCHAFRGTKVRKMHSSRRDAFKSVNCSPLARVRPGKIEFLNKFRARSSRAAELDTVFNDKVALVTFYPGQEPAILDYYFKEGYKGVVIQAVGLGHVAAGDAKHSWIGTIKRLVKEGFVICVAPQTIYGRLDSKIYSTGRELEKAGVVFLEDMLPETAFVKLGWALGHKNWKARDQIGDKMRENIAGELNEVITD